MKIVAISIALGTDWLLQAASYNTADQRVLNRTLATCPVGGIVDTTGKYCCPGSCGQCGGSGCDKRSGGASACCTSQITKFCSSSGLPCIVSGSILNACPTGGILDASGKTCCPAKCKTCGGSGCHLRPGGAAACCTSRITKSCTENKLPCKLTGTGTQPPMTNGCPAGGILDVSGKVCCPGICGTCGGSGCDKRNGGSANCCTSQISATCVGGKLPCVLGGSTITPTPTPAPIALCKDGILSDVVNGALDCIVIQGCCPKSCKTCFGGPSDQCTEAPECCVLDIAGDIHITDVDVSCRSRGPPCIMPPSDDPCSGSNPCQDGARCGVAQVFDDYSGYRQCLQMVTCECDEVGNSAGQFCEKKCGIGEDPCFSKAYTDVTSYVAPNFGCCPDYRECLPLYGESDRAAFYKDCIFKIRPETCDPNPCLNGGTCQPTSGFYDGYVCLCQYDFYGAFCESKTPIY